MQYAHDPKTGKEVYLDSKTGDWRPLQYGHNPQTGETVYYNYGAQQWMPMQQAQQQPMPSKQQSTQQSSSAPQGVRDWIRGIGTGATMGWLDEALGAASALGSQGLLNPYAPQYGVGASKSIEQMAPEMAQDYTAARDFSRAETDRFRRESPAQAMASEMLGSVGAGVATGLAAGGTAAGQALRSAPFMTRAAAAVPIGAAAGAVAGAGESRDVASMGQDALTGAAIGGALGPLAETVASAPGAIGRALSPQRGAERMLRRALRRGDMSPERVRAAVKKMGPDAVLADANDALLLELDRVVNTPGTARTRVLNQLTKRSNNQVDEILNATGPGQYYEILEQLKNARETTGSSLYKKAFGRGLEQTDELESIFSALNDVDKKLWSDAKKLGYLRLFGQGRDIPNLGDARPSFEGWQAVKEALDDKIGAALRANEGKKASAYMGVKNRLLKELDAQNPEYAAARKYWAGLEAFNSAMDDGQGFMQKSLGSAEFKNLWKNMDEPDRLAYKEGARQAIQKVLEKAGPTHNAAKYFDNRAMVEKLRTMFGAREATKILRTLNSSSAKQKTFATVRGNSMTSLRQQAQADEAQTKEVLGATLDAFTGSPTGAGFQFGRNLLRNVAGPREATRNILAEMLTETDPMAQARILGWAQGPGRPMLPAQGAGLIPAIGAGSAGGLLIAR